MKTIVIAGARSETGKTTLVCRFLRRFPQWAAVKIITYHTHKMPEEIGEKGFDIVEDTEILAQKGTDTGRMYELVGDNTLWVRTKPPKTAQAVAALFAHLTNFPAAIIEGTSILDYHKPDKAIMLVDNKGMKPSAQKVLHKIDLFLPSIHFDFTSKIQLQGYKEKFIPLNWNNENNFRELIKILAI